MKWESPNYIADAQFKPCILANFPKCVLHTYMYIHVVEGIFLFDFLHEIINSFRNLFYFGTISLIFIRSSIMTAEQSKVQSHHCSLVKWLKRCFLEIFILLLFKAPTQSNSLKNLHFYCISLFLHWFSSWDHNLWSNLRILQLWFFPGLHAIYFFISSHSFSMLEFL